MGNRILPLFASMFIAACAATAPAAPAPLLLPSGATSLPADGAESARKSFAAMGKSLADDRSTDVYIVQYDPATTLASALRRLIDSCGAVNVGAVPGGAYLVRATKSQCLALLESGAVETARPYAPGDKGAPVAPSGSDAKGLAPGAAPATIYTVSLFRDADEAAVRERLASFGGCEVLDGGEGTLRVRMTDAAHRRAAALSGVSAIGPWVEPKLFNDVATAAMRVSSLWPSSSDVGNAPAASPLGLTGKGQVVAVFDTGLCTGDPATIHPDVKGRIVKTFAYGRPSDNKTWAGDWSDQEGHGTHVAGSVLGDGSASGGRIRGPAYEAGLVFQSTAGEFFASGLVNIMRKGQNPYSRLLLDAYFLKDANGNSPRVHSDSWGGYDPKNPGIYEEASRSFDQTTFKYPDLLPVVAAGNDGVDLKRSFGIIDGRSIGCPATAKNVLTVGAAESVRSTGGYSQKPYATGRWAKDFPHPPISKDLVSSPASGKSGMAAFSSRGPCSDDRVKPDVVAPGTDILSLRAQSRPDLPDTWGPFNDWYHFMGGTSMATPLVSGAAVLVRQWLEEKRGIRNPDAATMKAVLCAGAKSLFPGQYGTGEFLEIPREYPNNVEGWGMVDLENSVANPDGVAVWNGEVIEEKSRKTYRIRVPGGKPLTILMAWNDAEGVLNQGGLVNDLDMTVTDPFGKVWFPNSRAEADHVNNVEGVRWIDAPAGEYLVTVVATRIQEPMDAKWTGNVADAIRFSLVANGAQPAAAAPGGHPAPSQKVRPPSPSEPEGGGDGGKLLLDSPYTFFGGYCFLAQMGQGTFMPLEKPSLMQVRVYENCLELVGVDENGNDQTIRFDPKAAFEAGDRKVFVLEGPPDAGWAFFTANGELALGFDMSAQMEGALLLIPLDRGDTRDQRSSEIDKGELGPYQFADEAFKASIEWLVARISEGANR